MKQVSGRFARPLREQSVAVEIATLLAVLVGMQVYVNLLNVLIDPLNDIGRTSPYVGRFLASDVVIGALALAGVATFVVVYVSVREIDVATGLPAREDAWVVGAAGIASASAALAFYGWVVGDSSVLVQYVTGGYLSSEGVDTLIRKRNVYDLAVFVPMMVLIYQGVVQNAFRRVFDRRVAAGLTALLVGVWLTGPDSHPAVAISLWLNLHPVATVLAGVVVATLGVAAYADDWSGNVWVRRLGALAVLAALVATLLSLVAEIGSHVDALYAVAELTVLWVTAEAYDRTESLATPAVTYGVFILVGAVLRNMGVVLALA